MEQEQETTSWLSAGATIFTAVAVTLLFIGAMAQWGGQDWLVPGGVVRNARAIQPLPSKSRNFGLADCVDRTLTLDKHGVLTIDGVEYDDDGLRVYLQQLNDAGGVRVVLSVTSSAEPQRQQAVEKICTAVTGLPPEVMQRSETISPVAHSGDLQVP